MGERVQITKFDTQFTNVSKGFALILLLWHHLFYELPESGFLVYQSAMLAKVCVAIYVVLSGYGLAESVKNRGLDIPLFFKKRFTKLYLNYWLIALIFIPPGIFFFARSLESVFGESPYYGLLVQMSGLHMFTDVGYGYNPTWWFMSLIVALYVLFPFIYRALERFGVLVLLVAVAIYFVPIPVLSDWIFPFALGVYLSQKNGLVGIFEWFYRQGLWRYELLFALTAFVAWYRQNGYLFDSLRIDPLFSILLIIWATDLALRSSIVKKGLEFIGIHSFNILLFHTFIFYFYFKEFIYSFGNPLLIFFVLLAICLVVSMGIERIKAILKIN